MYLIVFISICLLVLSLLSICAKIIPELRRSVLSYGKLNVENTEKPTTLWATQLAKLTVPKHFFSHFYVVGLTFAIYCIAELVSLDAFGKPLLLISILKRLDTVQGTHHLDKQTCIIGLTLMTLHLARRCYESFLIERPSKTATMHVSHYLIGIGFYGAMVFGTWLEGLSSFEAQSNNNNNSTIYTTVIAIGLFFYASLHQYNCHVILASLRKDTDKGYTIPRGDWFEQIVVPHYFADILIYLSLCILYRFQNCILLCGLIWTTTNLSIVASETHSWYQHHFTIEKLKITFPHRRWRIIPYVY